MKTDIVQLDQRFAEPNNFNVSVCPEPEEGFLQVAFRNERGEHGTTKVALLADWRNFSVKYRVFEGFVRIYYFRPEEVAEMTKRSFSSKETTSTSDKDDNIRPLSDQEFEYAEKQSRIERTLQAVCHSADFRNWVKSSGCREVYVREGKIHTTFSMAQQRSGAAAQPLPVPPTSVLIGGEQVRLGNRVVVQYETEKEEKEEKKEKKASTEQTYLK